MKRRSLAMISAALLLTPISVFIAFILPGNQVLPLGDLANLAVMASMIALASRGNIFRTVLAAIPVIIADLWIATKIAPFITGKIRLEDLVDKGFDTLINHNETAVKILVSPTGQGL